MAHLAHYKEAHPLPFRITHWVNLVAMVVLIITGFYIHYPFWPYFESMARGLHVFFGFVIFINCIIRIIMSFGVQASATGGSRKQKSDIWMWLPQKDNQHQLIEWVKYYLFMRKTHPLGAKLGVPQKLSYLLIPFLIIIMFITGLCLWAPTQHTGFCWALNNLVGGVMSMRIIHYFLMYVFIIFCFIHIYLANVEGTEPTKLMFFGTEHGGLTYDPDRHIIVGYDDLKGNIRHIAEAEDANTTAAELSEAMIVARKAREEAQAAQEAKAAAEAAAKAEAQAQADNEAAAKAETRKNAGDAGPGFKKSAAKASNAGTAGPGFKRR